MARPGFSVGVGRCVGQHMYSSFLYNHLKAYNTLHISCPLDNHLDHLRAGFQLLCWDLKYGCITGMDF